MGAIRFFTAACISIASAIAELLLIWVDRKRGRVFHAIARGWARTVLAVCSVRVTVRGLEKVDLSRNYVYVSNHASMFDIPVILAGIPEKIRHGASVLMYAEGTRTPDGKLQPFKRGAFNLALKAGIPVVPLTVNGSFSILPKHSISVRPGRVELVLDAPIPIPAGEGKDAEMHLMQDVHAVIERHYIDQG